MASETISTPKMIVPYEWILKNVEEQTSTTASKMILFRGQRVFRVGLKNYAKHFILFFMAIDLGKMGMKVEDVMYGIQSSGIGPATMKEMTKENIGDEGSLQLFSIRLYEKVLGNCTFVFRICIEGTDPGYSYQLCDRLAKDQLWASLKNEQYVPEIVFIVKNKKFYAHAAILAARSKVFSDEFMKKQLFVPDQIRMDGVEPSTMENFLHFVYTGEPIGTLADEELLKLADRYQLTTLASLCKEALKKITATQMTKLMESFNNGVEGLNSSKIMPEKDTEIFFDGTTPTFRCAWNKFKGSEIAQGKSKCLMQYQDEDMFFVHFTGHYENSSCTFEKPVIHFSCNKHRRFGLQVEDIYFSLLESGLEIEANRLIKHQEKNELLHFTVQLKFGFYYSFTNNSIFNIKTVSTIGNYNYEMMDDKWTTDLWMAATDQNLTDVEIFVGTVKVMEAHRVILCARSPVLNAHLMKSYSYPKSFVYFGTEFDVDTVKHFLNFLYTGRLKTTESVHHLSRLAAMYEVETLKNVCQLLLNSNPPDVEELTNQLMQL